MFIVLLRFSRNKNLAGQYMAAHNEWIQQGFDDGLFLLTGTLQPALGGAVLAECASLEALQIRLEDDPFVANDVVAAEIIEITPNRTDEHLRFLLG